MKVSAAHGRQALIRHQGSCLLPGLIGDDGGTATAGAFSGGACKMKEHLDVPSPAMDANIRIPDWNDGNSPADYLLERSALERF